MLDQLSHSSAKLACPCCSGALGVVLESSVGDAARFCASRDRQSTVNSRSKPRGPKTRASCVVVQKAARLSRWLDTARELQNHPHGQEPCGATRTESTKPMRRERARVGSAPGRGAAGRGQGGGAWLPQPTARCCWMRGRYITYFSFKSETRRRS